MKTTRGNAPSRSAPRLSFAGSLSSRMGSLARCSKASDCFLSSFFREHQPHLEFMLAVRTTFSDLVPFFYRFVFNTNSSIFRRKELRWARKEKKKEDKERKKGEGRGGWGFDALRSALSLVVSQPRTSHLLSQESVFYLLLLIVPRELLHLACSDRASLITFCPDWQPHDQRHSMT